MWRLVRPKIFSSFLYCRTVAPGSLDPGPGYTVARPGEGAGPGCLDTMQCPVGLECICTCRLCVPHSDFRFAKHLHAFACLPSLQPLTLGLAAGKSHPTSVIVVVWPRAAGLTSRPCSFNLDSRVCCTTVSHQLVPDDSVQHELPCRISGNEESS